MDTYQRQISEQLLLLHELQYSDPNMRDYDDVLRTGRHFRHSDAHRDVRFLDTIALALTTGKPGEVFAAAFDKREQMQLVLAKNRGSHT